MESVPASLGWRAVHPVRFWLGAVAVIWLVIVAGMILRAQFGVPFSAVEVWREFMDISSIVAPIHLAWWFWRIRGPRVGRALRAVLPNPPWETAPLSWWGVKLLVLVALLGVAVAGARPVTKRG